MTSWQALGLGVGLGIGAGITPGPLLALIMNETLRGGWQSGMVVAFAPPLGDIVVVALCFSVLSHLPDWSLPLLGMIGGFYILLLAWETLRTTSGALPSTTDSDIRHGHSLLKGLIVNLLNPHPYIFWMTVAGPLISHSYQQSAFGPILAFVSGFYGCLVGSKLALALLIHNGRARLQGRGYQLALWISGGCLFLFALGLIWGGVRQL